MIALLYKQAPHFFEEGYVETFINTVLFRAVGGSEVMLEAFVLGKGLPLMGDVLPPPYVKT